ncbi:MAG TPA: glycoside hydrolase family 127 protein [Longimicrobiales bacterium]|nr:glycoside hydrolase family 127 protein [Longimicrobiales bacterium]
MTMNRRTALKLGIGAGALPLLDPSSLVAETRPAGGTPRVGPDVRRARPLPLTAVRLEGGPLKAAQDADRRYLLELEPDRMLAYYRERAGLRRKAEPYAGWDGGGRNLTGHIAGHYLSAVSLMYAATGDPRFKERADHIVAELKEVQDANKDGYLGALEGGREAFERLAKGEIRASSFDLNGQWSPWYTLHKTYAGLRDAYRHTGNKTALAVEVAYAKWAERILSGLSEAQLEHMMNAEFGGMNEVMVDLYEDTGDRRWLELSYRFEHDDFIQPLKRHQDNLPGKHGNTAVPKLLGNVNRFILTGDAGDLMASSFFWDTVVHHHTFATGGHGKDEYFGPPDTLGARIGGRTCESCNVYNMLKLTRQLFSLRPDPEYADFQERALFNHALASIDTSDSQMCYMVPVGQGVQHEYQDMLRSFTCCVGTGMENHALHGHGIYYEDGERLFVNLYAPSTAEWKEAGVRLAVETGFPDTETATIRLSPRSPREFTLALRRPYWAGDGFAVKVNGQPVALPDTAPEPWRERGSQYPVAARAGSSYVDVKRTWRSGDVVEITLPKSLRLEPTPDRPRRAALLWGPLVLAGDLGPERRRARGPEREDEARPPVVPVLVAAEKPVESWLQPAGGAPGRFRTAGVGRAPDAAARPLDVDLVPFYQLPKRTYALHWDLFTEKEWDAEKARYAAEAERLRRLEAATVAYIEPGEAVFEGKFGYQGGEGAAPYRMEGRPSRTARSWFSYNVPVDSSKELALILTFNSDDRRYSPADFEILIDGKLLAAHHLGRTDPPRFYDVTFPIPAELVRGKNSVTLRFQAKEGSQVPAIFGVRVVRAGELA